MRAKLFVACTTELTAIVDHGCARGLRNFRDPAPRIEGVAIMIAERKPRAEFSQIACVNGLAAKHAKGLRARRPAIHQNEPHVALPDAKHAMPPLYRHRAVAEESALARRRAVVKSIASARSRWIPWF
jgi:hypothetical protein